MNGLEFPQMKTLEAPEQLHINFQNAFNRHDLDAIVVLYEPGAVLARHMSG